MFLPGKRIVIENIYNSVQQNYNKPIQAQEKHSKESGCLSHNGDQLQ